MLAEYALLHMLSRVHTRTDGLALGSLTLNIVVSDAAVAGAPAEAPPLPTATGNAATGFALSRTSLAAAASSFGRMVCGAYDSVMARCVPLPLSLPVLCSLQLVPAKVSACGGGGSLRRSIDGWLSVQRHGAGLTPSCAVGRTTCRTG